MTKKTPKRSEKNANGKKVSPLPRWHQWSHCPHRGMWRILRMILMDGKKKHSLIPMWHQWSLCPHRGMLRLLSQIWKNVDCQEQASSLHPPYSIVCYDYWDFCSCLFVSGQRPTAYLSSSAKKGSPFYIYSLLAP